MADPINIKFSPVYCTITTQLEEAMNQELYDHLAYRPEGYFFSPQYQSGQWDGYKHLYQPVRQKFRIGVLSKVLDFFEKRGSTVCVTGIPAPSAYTPRATSYVFRFYQTKAAECALEKRFGIIQAPPRSGKTLIAAGIMDSERKFPAVFFVRSKDLMRQTVNRFREYLKDTDEPVTVGMVGDGICDIQDINVVTIQSAFMAYDKECEEKKLSPEAPIENKFAVKRMISSAQVVFYDEVHHAQSRTSRFILDKCVNATLKIGLSATPFRTEDTVEGEEPDADEKEQELLFREEQISVEECLGPILYEIGYEELIAAGFLLRPVIYTYKLPKMRIEGNYQSVYKQGVVDNEVLSGLIAKLVKKLTSMGKSVVVQTELRGHSRQLGELLDAPVLLGDDTTEDRIRIIDGLTSKKILCVVSTLFEEGLDIPTLDYTINAAGGLSNISTFQRMRSITRSDGKETCGVIDFVHQCKYLQRHSKVRLKHYKSVPSFTVIERDVSHLTMETLDAIK